VAVLLQTVALLTWLCAAFYFGVYYQCALHASWCDQRPRLGWRGWWKLSLLQHLAPFDPNMTEDLKKLRRRLIQSDAIDRA
jgi:hypothetical protein